MKNGVNHDHVSIQFEEDRVGKSPQKGAAKGVPNQLEQFGPTRAGRISHVKLVQQPESESGFTLLIPGHSFIGFLFGFRLDDDASHDVLESAPSPRPTGRRVAGSRDRGGGGDRVLQAAIWEPATQPAWTPLLSTIRRASPRAQPQSKNGIPFQSLSSWGLFIIQPQSLPPSAPHPPSNRR